MLGHDLDDDDDRNTEQHAPDTPEPAPEQQRDENGRRVHSSDSPGHPGGDEGADKYGDHQRCSRNQQSRAERAELHKGHHPGGGGGEARTQVRDDMKQTRGDRPRARVVQADPAERHPGEQRHEHVGDQQHEHVVLDGVVDITEDLRRDLLVRQRRPGESDQLSLVGVAGQQEKENEKQHHDCLTHIAHGSHGTRPEEIADFECGRIVDDDARRGFVGCGGHAGRLTGRLFELARGGLYFLHRIELALPQFGEARGQLARGFGQLLDDCLHLSAQCVGSEPERAHDGHDHQAGARHPMNLDPFQPHDEGAQRVGQENPEQQGDKKALRPLQCEYHGDRGQDDQRQALRVYGDAGRARRRDGVRHRGCGTLVVFSGPEFSIHGGFIRPTVLKDE